MKYSDRLGEISDQQFQNALNRFALGTFVKAEPIHQGLFGQNLFLTSSTGEYLLRGVPHYSWQFKSERFFAELLHGNTSVPVPWPYLLDESNDIFGWSYVIMPRLKGHQLSDSSLGLFSDGELKEIAQAQGEMLAEAQSLTWTHCGTYDEEIDNIKQSNVSFFTGLKSDILEDLGNAASYNDKTTREDIEWVEEEFKTAGNWLSQDFQPCFVMQDYKPGNMVVDKIDGRWRVTGLFDLMESCFGHGEADLSRMYCVYVELERRDLAQAFVDSYEGHKSDTSGLRERFPIFVIYDRAIIWEWVQREDRAWWNNSLSFRQWVNTFLC
jgi:hygromycin-B 7''-O-kinase